MTDRQTTGTKQDADRTVLSVPEAAQRLGVTPDAIRARLHRGTLAGEKQGGEWTVFLSVEPAPSLPRDFSPTVGEKSDSDRPDIKQDATGKQSDQTGHRQDADRQTVAALIAAKDQTIDRMDAEIAFLRDQLDKRSQELADERERSDVLHREAFARIEVLTAGLGTSVPNDQAPESMSDEFRTESVRNSPESPQTRDVAPSATEAASPSTESSSGVPDGPHGGFARWWTRIFGR